ncbi:hypothetical protein T265_15796, partial [Opisthorchis viverrini]
MDELYEVLKESGNAESTSIKDLQAFIREYDEDGDGKLNYHEFLDYLLDRPNEALLEKTSRELHGGVPHATYSIVSSYSYPITIRIAHP